MGENRHKGAFASQGRISYQKGLTKREYFAAMAMQGLCSMHNQDGESTYNAAHGIGQEAVNIADNLLRAL